MDMSNIIPESELIIRPDGSIYHLGLLPEQLCDTIITVGDPDRVDDVTVHFDRIFYTHQVREFKTTAGEIGSKSIMVVSTGIGTDNIDIVFNELNALANINFQSRILQKKHRALSLFRIGTSGSLRKEIPIDSLLVSEYTIGLDGLMHFYSRKKNKELSSMQSSFDKVLHLSIPNIDSYACKSTDELFIKKLSKKFYRGCTLTASGFYGPQGRVLSAPLVDKYYLDALRKWKHKEISISNFEMETAGIYGMAEVLGHKAVSLNAIIANRESNVFSKNVGKTVDKLIKMTLDAIV